MSTICDGCFPRWLLSTHLRHSEGLLPGKLISFILSVMTEIFTHDFFVTVCASSLFERQLGQERVCENIDVKIFTRNSVNPVAPMSQPMASV